MKKTVSIVIPCWNSESQLREHLPSILVAAQKVKAEIIVVDDASMDNSVEFLKTQKNRIRTIEHKENKGFSATVNRGVREATGDIVILLNTDVEPAPDCLSHAVTYFTSPDLFAVGFNSGEGWMGGEWRRGLFQHFRVGPFTQLQPTYPSLWASGGQAAFDRRKWQELGGMDLLYRPFYWEDTDLGFRAWKRGWEIIWAEDCHVEHHHKKSVIANNFSDTYVTFVATRNQFLFVWKNISDISLLLSHLVRLPLFIKNYPKSFLAALNLLPQAMSSRLKESKYWKVTDRDILERWRS